MIFLQRIRVRLFIVLFLLGIPSLAQAQTLPSSADPSRLDDRFDRVISSKKDEIAIPRHSHEDTPIPEAVDGFLLKAITLEGITANIEQELQPIIGRYIGRSVDLNVLNHLASQLTSYYQEQGYFLSKAVIPAQEVENGRVIIQITEGYIHDVIIDDPLSLLKMDHLDITARTIGKIKAMQPLHGPTLERYMLLLNEGAGVNVKSILDANKEIGIDGAVNIILQISKNKDRYVIDYNNHGSKFIGPHQVEMAYVTGNILNAYDTLTLQATTTLPIKELQYGSIGYSLPIHDNGLNFTTSFSYTSSKPGYTLESLDVEGDSFAWKAGVEYPVIRSRRTNLKIGGALNVKNSATEFLDEELIDDKIRSIVLDVSYNTQSEDGSVNNALLELHKGLDILGSRETGESNLSRTQGRSDFFKVTAQAARIQTLPISGLSLLAQAEGQYAPHPLLSSEEFGYGGAELGRAYDFSEITGDSGISGGLELRYSGIASETGAVSITPFVFYDIGKVWNKDTGSKPLSATSAGMGTYYQINQRLNGSAMIAYPLTKSVSNPVMGGRDGPRILFELSTQF